MNFKVAQYRPLLLPTDRPPLPRKPQTPQHRHWKDYLSQEVQEQYHSIISQRTANKQANLTVDTEEVGRSQTPSMFSRTEIKGGRSQMQWNTQKKEKREVGTYSSLSASIRKERDEFPQSRYRMQLIEEECNYLRKQFIAHCLRHHRQQFEGSFQ